MENYIIDSVINSGSFGTVKKAVDLRTNRHVAIKFLPLKRHDVPSVKNTNMINREIEIWSTLSQKKHPNILHLEEYHMGIENAAFVSEYCKRGTLADIQLKTNFNISEVKYIIKSVLNGLLYCHQLGILHSDIKPANILLSDDDNFKLCDFGHCQKNIHEFEGLWFRRGTPLYMSPEFYDHIEYGNNVDIWAVGILTYTLIFNKHPFFKKDDVVPPDFNNKSKFLEDLSLKSKSINIPENLAEKNTIDFLKKCLEYDKTKRLSCQEAIKHPFLN